jgi:hypothetical protein
MTVTDAASLAAAAKATDSHAALVWGLNSVEGLVEEGGLRRGAARPMAAGGGELPPAA